MNTKTSQDTYQVYCKGYLGEDRVRTLTLLYQPLAKAESFALYMSLYHEVERGRILNTPSTHYRLMHILQMNITTLEDSLACLEGLGLLRTYQKQEGNQADYIYEVLMPLSPRHFFKNALLNTLLYRSLGEVDYEKTRFYFSCPQIDEKKYRNITRRFDEVFHVDLDNEHLVLAKDQFGQDIQKEPQVAYDLEMFYRGLQDYQIPLSAITKEVEKAICQYGTIYHIAPTIMRELIYDVYDHHQIIIEDLQKRCLRYYEFEKQVQPKEVYAKQPKPSHNQPTKNKREEKIRQLASLSPYEYLCALQNGSAPTARDLSLIENLLTKQQLPSGVVNVLIETVLRMNQGQLPRNHLEYLAGTFARKKIDTVEKAIEEAKVYMASKKNLDVQIEKPKVQEISKVEKEEYEALRKEIEMMLKGG